VLDEHRSVECAVICAGGMGTRLATVFPDTPKALVPVLGEPIILNQIQRFVAAGVKDFIFLLGFEASKIISVLEEFRIHSCNNINFRYFVESVPLGSGGALLSVLNLLPSCFYFVYCDVYFDLDLKKMSSFHFSNYSDFTLLAHPNDHPSDSDLLEVSEDNGLLGLLAHPHNAQSFCGNLVNAAFYIMNASILFELAYSGSKLDFAQDCIPHIIGKRSNRVLVYRSPEFAKDMGTPERLKKVEKQFSSRYSGSAANPVVFLDRDGTLNAIRIGDYVRRPDDVTLLDRAAEAIKLIRDKGYFVVLITNQPVVARGDVSTCELKRIHDRLEFLLGEVGAYLDAIYYCPHHPDSGFLGENTHLKVKCDCRKPGIGLFERAARYILPDPKRSWMVGDSPSDVIAGRNFGIMTAQICDRRPPFTDADLYVESLYEFAAALLDLT
jgi:histidinol-phosphate phosphatase family protein